MKSYLALNAFVDNWRDSPSFFVDAHGNCTFRAHVNYESPKVNVSQSTIVRIRRGEPFDGKVHIESKLQPAAELSYLQFNPLRHIYEYATERGLLRIRGQSDRVGGDYTVTICPA